MARIKSPAAEPEATNEQREVPIDKIEVGVLPNPRTIFEGIEELAEDILRVGLHNPVFVWEHDDHLILLGGERRLRALTSINKRFPGKYALVPTTVFHGTEEQARAAQITDNTMHDELNPVDKANAIAGFQERFGMTEQQAADRLKLSRTQVSKLLRIRKRGSPALLLALAEGSITIVAAADIVSKEEHELQDELLAKFLDSAKKRGKGKARRETAEAADRPLVPTQKEMCTLRDSIVALADDAGWKRAWDALRFATGKNKAFKAAVARALDERRQQGGRKAGGQSVGGQPAAKKRKGGRK